jgi:hypothetical protein
MKHHCILSSEVDRDLHRCALEAARDAASILGIDTPRIQWMKCNEYEHKIGWVYPSLNVIHLDADWCKRMGPEQARALVFHEMRHFWQQKNFRYNGPGDKARAEDDAESFSFRHTRVLIERPDYEWRYMDYYA